MRKYDLEGKAHRLMRAMLKAPITRPQAAEILRGPEQTPKGADARAYRTLMSMRHDRLIQTSGEPPSEAWHLTSAGRRECAEMDRDALQPALPSVRIFAKESI